MSAGGGWAAFLRGVNVGGRRKLAMAELADFVAELGAAEVRTYLQSGNVTFRALPRQARHIEQAFPSRSEARFGFPVAAVLRSAGELRGVLGNNPFLAAGADEGRLHVMFLADIPDEAAVDALDPGRSPPDAFAVRGRDVYLHLPNGVGRSKLTNAYFDRVLGTLATARNWRTVRGVAALLEA